MQTAVWYPHRVPAGILAAVVNVEETMADLLHSQACCRLFGRKAIWYSTELLVEMP